MAVAAPYDPPQELSGEEPLVRGDKVKCPWCKEWQHIWNYTRLKLPPGYEKQVSTILKCTLTGCKQLFAVKLNDDEPS